jgi:hypothetical protein
MMSSMVRAVEVINTYAIYVHCRKIYNLFVRALGTCRKSESLASANYFLYLPTMYVCCVYPAISKSPKTHYTLSDCLEMSSSREKCISSSFKHITFKTFNNIHTNYEYLRNLTYQGLHF